MREPTALPSGVDVTGTTDLDRWRNRVAGRLANAALRLATPTYRKFIGGAILHGMDAAARDVVEDRSKPPPVW